MKSLRFVVLFTLLTAAMVLGITAAPAGAADHLDAPLVQVDGRTDINDIYLFQSPDNADKTVMIMTVNPLAGIVNPTTFDDKASYQFRFDTDGDARVDMAYLVDFGKPRPDQDGAQRVKLTLKQYNNDRRTLAKARGWTGETVYFADQSRLYAGTFDDPFFFDLVSFQNGLSFCQTDPSPDFFAGLNVSAIVIEAPTAWFSAYTNDSGENIGMWAVTRKNGSTVDRMGRPAINTVFIPSDQKDAFNAGLPKNDRRDFTDEVVGTLLALGNDEATATTLASILLPDILTFTTGDSSGFLNGRQVADDVIDAELNLITGGAVPGDCVDANDVQFPGTFPYLAPAHE